MFTFYNNSYNRQNYSSRNIVESNNVDFETLQNARKDLIGEIQAVIEYDENLHNTNDRMAKETWQNIKSEELTHVGELLALLNHLDPNQKQYVEKGISEFNERLNKK